MGRVVGGEAKARYRFPQRPTAQIPSSGRNSKQPLLGREFRATPRAQVPPATTSTSQLCLPATKPRRPNTQQETSNRLGSGGKSCPASVHLTPRRSRDTTRLTWAVSGSRVTNAAWDGENGWQKKASPHQSFFQPQHHIFASPGCVRRDVSISSCLGQLCLMLSMGQKPFWVFRKPTLNSTHHFPGALSSILAKNDCWSSSIPPSRLLSARTHLFPLLLEMVLLLSPVQRVKCLGDEEQRWMS